MPLSLPRPPWRGLGASAALGALVCLELVRLDPAQDDRPALLLLALGAAYGGLVALLLRAARVPRRARPLAGLLGGALPLALLLPLVSAGVERRWLWMGAAALLGLLLGMLEATFAPPGTTRPGTGTRDPPPPVS